VVDLPNRLSAVQKEQGSPRHNLLKPFGKRNGMHYRKLSIGNKKQIAFNQFAPSFLRQALAKLYSK
jgi:hypothetical protein